MADKAIARLSLNNKEVANIKNDFKPLTSIDEDKGSKLGSTMTKKKTLKDLEDLKKTFTWMKKSKQEYWYNTALINETADKALCKLWMVVAVCVVFIIAEVVGGLIANS